MNPLFLLLFLTKGCLCYKFLVYNPLFGHSHTTFMAKIADTLFEAGHEVTVFSPLIDENLINKTGLKSGAKLIRMEQDPRAKEMMEHLRKGMFSDAWTMIQNPISMMKLRVNFTKAFGYTCEAVASNNQIIDTLRAEKFDVGIAESLSVCGFGLFEHLGIPSTIGAASVVHIPLVSWLIGEPTTPCYVPHLMSTEGDQMTFLGRLQNAVGTVFGSVFFYQTFVADSEAMSRIFEKEDLIAKTSFMFTNGNPYLNYPRPLLHKTVEIGGISVDVENVGELGEKWDAILNERKHTVFMSFGSIAKSKDMPDEWKKSILAVCKSMTDVTFIWKYEEPTSMADHLPNVYLSSWLPQSALLADSRLSLFITHGGLGSTNEVAHFAKPAIMVPLFGDQMRNSEMLARHGGAVVFQKTDLANEELLQETIRMTIKDTRFSKPAKRLAEMLREQPVSPKELVVSHAEFAAKFGPLQQLDPYGRQLNLFQYYLVDVIVCLLVVVFVSLFTLFLAIRWIVCRSCWFTKVKID